jgi:dihydrofolate reductase
MSLAPAGSLRGMGKLVITEFITLDGTIEDPGGAEKTPFGGWAFKFERGPEGDKFKGDELWAADAQLLGRVTYEGFAQAWPQMNQDDFGRKFNEMPKHVVSSTLENPEWQNSHVVRGDLATEIAKLKAQYEGDILLAGSASLTQSLLELDLVDQINLMVYPLLAGGGKKLFPETDAPRSFELVSAGQAGETVTMILRRRGE